MLSRVDGEPGSPVNDRQRGPRLTPLIEERRAHGAKFLLILLVAYGLTYWALFYAMIGLPTVGQFYLGLAAFLFVLRIGWPIIDHCISKSR